jgi:sugar transferase (PEP-CTERM system associated)
MIRILGQYVAPKTIILAVTDSVLLIASIGIAAWIRFGSLEDASWYLSQPYAAAQICIATLICWVCLYYYDLYNLEVVARRAELVVHLMQALGTTALALAILYYMVPDLALGRGVSLLAAALVCILLLSWRLGVDAGKFFRPAHRVLIAGTGDGGIRLVQDIIKRPELNLKVVGFLDEKGERIGESLVNPGIVGGVADITELVRRERVDWVVLAFAERRGVMPAMDLLRLRLSGIKVEEAHSLYENLTGRVMLDRLSPSWLFLSEGFRKDYLRMLAKRVTDLVISTIALILLFPVVVIVSLAIVLDSGFPVLFKQDRVGFEGRIFKILKFRSMVREAEANGPRWATQGDARITRVGKILRQYRLDEIPQLINVLKGDMSLVGPRPERPEFVRMLGEQIPYFVERQSVRPGITGWAQVKYQYTGSVEDSKTKLEYDLFYIKHLSFFLDLTIVLRTIQVVLFARGSL